MLFIQIYDINDNAKEPFEYKLIINMNKKLNNDYHKKRPPITGSLSKIYIGI